MLSIKRLEKNITSWSLLKKKVLKRIWEYSYQNSNSSSLWLMVDEKKNPFLLNAYNFYSKKP